MLITHQGNSQVKDNKIDLLVQQYEQFVISEDESIDSAFARFNTIITSLKALDEGYSSKNYVRKFLRALHPKWRAKVTAIEESKDLTSLSLDELIGNLKVHEMIIKKDSEIVKAKVERKSLALKAKKESSDEECSTSESEDEEYAMATRTKEHLSGGFWSDSGEEDDEKVNNKTCLVAQASSEVCSESFYFSDENSSIDDSVVDNEYDKLCKMSLKIITKNKKLKATKNNLENELSALKKVYTLEKNKGVDLECVKCHMLKIENEKLKEEVTRLNKFEKSTQCLNEKLSNQKLSGEKLGLGFNLLEASSSGTKEIKFVKAQKKEPSDGGPINMGGPQSVQAAPKTIMGPPPVGTHGSEKNVSFQKSILGLRPKHIIVNNVKVPVPSDNEVKQFYKPLSKPGVGFLKPNFRSKTPPPRSVMNNYHRPKTPQPKRNVGRQNQPRGFPICLGVDLEPDEWIKDSGCSKHMAGNRKLFSSYKAYNGGNVIFGSNLRGNIIGKGQICDNKCRVTFSEHDSEITKDGKVIGHANMRLIQSLASKELVRNLPKLKFDQHFCDACKIGKQAHASHKAKNIVSTTRCLELLHMDLFGPSAKNRFETYVKSKDLDLWHVITDGDFQPIVQNLETKLDEVIPFEKQTDDLKKKLAKNNEAKMVIYNALPRKEYERIFMCNTAKEIWKTLLITHQGNSQVKDNKIDLLVQQYEQFVISEDESIDSAFARFNTIITSLKALDEGYSSKNYIRKFLRALHPKWRAKVTAIEESKDLTSLSLDELIGNLKAKKESSDEECSTSGSEDEEYAMAVRDFKKFFKRRSRFVRQLRNDKNTFQRSRDDKNGKSDRKCFRCGDPNHLIGECPKPPKDKNQRAFVRGSWSDSGEEDDEKVKNETCLVAHASSEVCSESSYFSDENSSIDDLALDNEYDKLCKMSLKIITKNKRLKATRNNLENELRELKDKLSTLEKNKGVNLDCAKCHTLKIENEKLKEESTRLNKFEKSTHCLNEMLSNQKPSGDKLGLGFNSFEASSSGTKEIKFVKAQKKTSSDGGPINMGGPQIDQAAPKIIMGPPPATPGSEKIVSFQKSILGPRPKHIIVNKVKIPVASDNEVKQFYKPLSKPGVGFLKPNFRSKTPPPRRVNNNYSRPKTPQPKRHVGRQNQPHGSPICLGVDLEPDEWIKDCRCSKHMTGNRKIFSTYKAYNGGNVIFGSNLRGNIIGKGQICDNKCRVTFSKHDSEITKDSRVIGIGIRKKGLYVMKLGNKPKDQICLATIDENSTLWHRRLGHANMRLVQSLASKELVRNLPKLKFDQHFCDACKMGKQAHASHEAKNIFLTTRCLELLHIDLFGPSDFCNANGITHNFSAPRTPQSNGVVERKNRTLQEMSRTTLNGQSLPQKFWCNAVDTSTYILNRILIRAILGKTHYKLLRGRKPTLDYFIVFGSKCFILNTKDYLTKFDPKSYEGVFLGYSQNSKAYIILNKHTRKVEESLNVTFDETPPPSKTSPLVDDDLDEEESIKVTKKKNLENDIVDETLEIDEIVNIKESRNHPLENVIGNLNQRTLRNKLDENGVVSRNKARLVAQGYNQQEGIDCDETYALVARLESIRILLAYACALDFKLFQMDVKSAFLNGFINEEFEISMMGELNFFLGLQIKQMEDGIFFNQSKYIKEMLKKFGLEDSKPMKTPMSSDTKLTKDEECESVDSTKYRGMIAVKRIFRYIKGTTHLGLWYPKGTGIETVVYADSDHARDYVDRKSTSGICTFVGCCLTSWFSKKQTALAISTTEAEYVSVGKACQQALWMKQALIDYDVRLDDVPIMCDNKGAIDLSKNPVQHSRTKHIEIRHHFLRDNVQKGHISIEKVSSVDNIADILTKPLKRESFNYLRLGLGMMEHIP
ncbi:retrovirus-related pol polyprotein from transposon TNT 1-94 [Tanacetum coccineum]|uniref:Retrovirus-related pol polyprotein from transposon TNT 1-94 n=1 Tax=Tanacetum coccineum TaxID=301880 RepID=A0ABQ4XMM5_9ASTR